MATRSFKAGKEIRAFLAEIGGIGGSNSRRELTPRQAKQMVAIREAKREAIKKGKIEWALKRIPLPKEKSKPPRGLPAVQRRRMIGNVLPLSRYPERLRHAVSSH